jgi:hypothetical protein
MPEQPSVQDVVKDPDFLALPINERVKVLGKLDTDFAGLPPGEQMKAAIKMTLANAQPSDVPANQGNKMPNIDMQEIGGVGSKVGTVLNSAPSRFVSGAVEPTMQLMKNPGGLGQGGLVQPTSTEEPPPFTWQMFKDSLSNASLKNVLTNTLSDVKSMNPVAMDKFKSGDVAGGIGQTMSNIMLLRSALKPATEAVLPSTERAGQAFSEVEAAAGDHPVNINPAGQQALKIQELAQSGGSMPKVVKDFLKRVTDPEEGPLTYSEARKFYSNATRISADEANRLTPVMKRQLSIFTQTLGSSIADTAGAAGKMEQYRGAMGEYRNASRLRSAKEAMVDYFVKPAIKAIPYGAGAAAGYKIYEASK